MNHRKRKDGWLNDENNFFKIKKIIATNVVEMKDWISILYITA